MFGTGLRRGFACAHNGDLVDLHRTKRTVARAGALVAWCARNLFYESNRRGRALPEDGIAAIQTWLGRFGNKELGAVRIRQASVCVSQPSRTIEHKSGRNFQTECKTHLARARS